MVKNLTLLILLFLLTSCSAEKPQRTELVLVADTDIGRLEKVEFSIEGPGKMRQTAEGPTGASAPGARSLGLLYEGGKLGPLTLKATGLIAGKALLSRAARVYFVKGQTKVVPLHLLDACIDFPCPGDEQCTERGCEPLVVDSNKLPDWDGSAPMLPRTDAGASSDSDANMSTPEAGVLTDTGVPATDAGSDAGPPLPDGGIGSCDGVTTNLGTDPQHCGSCNEVCAVPGPDLHLENPCVNGKCTRRCLPHFGNCDSDLTTGCETPLTDQKCGPACTACVGNRYCDANDVCTKRPQ